MRTIDISQGWHEGMPKFDADWYPEFRINHQMTPETDPARVGRTFTSLTLFAHNGTHVESSLHFAADGVAIHDVPLDTFIGRTCVADVSHIGDLQPVSGSDLDAAVGHAWTPGDRLLIRTDHPLRHLGAADYWDTPPYLDPSAADWILDNRASLVGMDCITEKPGDPAFPIHRAILLNGIPLLENIANLHRVEQTVVWLCAAPVAVAGVEAAPARAVVIEGLLSN